MKINKIISIVLSICILSSLSACGIRQNEGEKEYSFTDSEGTVVTLDKKPQTVAVLFSSYADIWQTAGGKTAVTVYESVERGFADEDAILVDSGSGHTSIDLETLVSSQPDFVIGTTDYESQRQAISFCRNANIPSALFQVESVDDYLAMLKICCDLLDTQENYERFGVQVKQQIDETLSLVDKTKTPTKILFIRAGSSANSTKAKTTEDNFACAMLSQMNTVNIADGNSTLTGTLSLEVILQENPERLFITTMGNEQAAIGYMTSLLQSVGWSELDCVKNNRYTFLPKDLFHFKPNARWAEAYRYLAEQLD